MTRGQPAAVRIEQLADEGARLGLPVLGKRPRPLIDEFGLNRVPERAIDDRLVLAGMALSLMGDLADIDWVREEGVQRPSAEEIASDPVPVAIGTGLGPDTASIEMLLQQPDRSEFQVTGIDGLHGLRLGGDYDQLAVLDLVAKWGTPPIHMPFRLEAAILSRIRSPVTSRSNWAKDSKTFSVRRPMRGRGVELLGDRDERDAVRIEHFDHLGEVGERAG